MPTSKALTSPAISSVFYGETAVRLVPHNGEVWFVGRDVCEVLAIKDASKALERLDADEKGTANHPTLGGNQNLTVISEAGVYRLIFTSRRPEAEAVKRWLAHEVLPSIHKTGGYEMPASPGSPTARDRVRNANRIRFAKMNLVSAALRLEDLGVDVTAISMASVLDFGRRLKAIGARP